MGLQLRSLTPLKILHIGMTIERRMPIYRLLGDCQAELKE